MMQESMKIKGSVVVMKKNLFELNDVTATFRDGLDEILGHKVSLQLISAVNTETHGMSFCFQSPPSTLLSTTLQIF